MTAKELKASILQLAVTGKLVPQDLNDEPASVLLERIKAEKAKLVKVGKIKKDKNPSEIVTGSDGAVYEKFKDGTAKDISDELPFEIPDGWAWACLIDLFNFIDYRGKTPKKISSGIRLITAKNVRPGFVNKEPEEFISKEEFATRQSRGLAKRGDILFTTEAPMGYAAIVDEDVFSTGQRLITFQQYGKGETRNNRYFMFVILSPFFQQQLVNHNTGVTVSGIKGERLKRFAIPVPPLAEQKRIVAKIDKLMPLVEEYGEMEETRLQLDADLPSALEKSILQEAIQGKLVPQDPNDEPASELLKRIAAERKALVKAGKLKRDKCESVIFRGSDRLAYETRHGETICIQDEIPFDIPDSWEWVRLEDMSNYGQCTSVDTADIAPDTWSLDLEEIEKGTGRLIERKTAAEKKSKSSKHVFTKGTLLYSKLRTYLNKVLVADMDGVCTSEIVPIELNGGVNAEYVRLVLMSPYFLEYTASKGYGVKMPRVGTDDMKQSLIPLPPLDEQRRIVKRVEELKATARTLVTV